MGELTDRGDSTSWVPVAPEVLDEQLAYYRARAPEYDEWFLREGRYDRGEVATLAWHADVAMVRRFLDELDLADRDVLELAAGTGLWTEQLLLRGASVTAVDAAPEMLEQLGARLCDDRLRLVQADLFAWRPAAPFDAVVACFFMSHVPDERFGPFLELVASSLRPSGAVFLLDGLAEPSSTASDHELPAAGVQTMRRQLNDGRSYEIVKRFRTDEELVAGCAAQGLDVEVRRTPRYFQVVVGTRT